MSLNKGVNTLESADATGRRPPCLLLQDSEVPTCLALPEGLLQPVGPHVLAGQAHRQLLAAHPEILSPDVRRIKIGLGPAPCVMPLRTCQAAERRGDERRREEARGGAEDWCGRDLEPGPAGYSHALACHAVRSVLGAGVGPGSTLLLPGLE